MQDYIEDLLDEPVRLFETDDDEDYLDECVDV